METRGLKFSIAIENFDRDWKFRAGIEIFDRDCIFSIAGPSGSEGHNPPQGSPRNFASLEGFCGGSLRGFCEGLSEGSAGLLRASAGLRGIFRVLGRDMRGCKTYGGRKTYQRTRSPENFWTPPKELLVCSVVDFCTGKTERWRLRGVENVPYEGGSKTPFWEGCHSWGFPPPSLFHPPMASSDRRAFSGVVLRPWWPGTTPEFPDCP